MSDDATIHLRVSADLKGRWVRQSRAEGKRLTEWIIEKIGQDMETNIDQLKRLGIEIPIGATGYHTEGHNIVFSVNIWPADEEHFQGKHRFDTIPITAEQWGALPSRKTGPGVMLEVADAHGYQGE